MSIESLLGGIAEDVLERAVEAAIGSLGASPPATIEEAARVTAKLAIRHIIDELAKKELGG